MAIIRAGDLADRVTYYRHDLAFEEDPSVASVDPHFHVTLINDANPLVQAVARGAQEQIATFLASDGATLIHPEPARLFEVPIVPPLPEGLNFILPR